MMSYSLEAIARLSRAEFVEAFGAVFEATPAIAQRVWEARPFTSRDDLHRKMAAVVADFSPEEQLQLLRSHPDLGSRAQMAPASVAEQAGVGLDRLTPKEYNRLQELNCRYTETFDFPFIIAVKNHTKASILAAFEARLANSRPEEIERAIAEVIEIARLRLELIVT